MKKLLAIALVLAALLTFSGVAWSGYFFEDPIYQIGDATVNVLVGRDTSEPVSLPTQVKAFVPGNVSAAVVDPFDCIATVKQIGSQSGPLRVSLVMVRAARTDAGHAYPVQVTVFDNDGYVLTIEGHAGAWITVPYIKWVR